MNIKKTPLNEVHRKLGGRMVHFAGWDMPVQYSGILDEHLSVRNNAGLFDVSHMGEIEVRGKDALRFVDYIATNDVTKLKDGMIQYTAMCYEDGGTVDDLLIYRFNDRQFLLVVNATNTGKDHEWLVQNKRWDVEIADVSNNYTQIALQGPKSIEIFKKLTKMDLDEIKFYRFATGNVDGVEMIVSKTGYTGEDGLELYFENSSAERIWNDLMEAGKADGLKPVGLGARDTLRLEMGFSLYGHELSKEISPLEAGIGWVVKLKAGDFIGRDALVQAKAEGIKRKIVALRTQERQAARKGYRLFSPTGEEAGYVTSGSFAPYLKYPIAMALVDTPHVQAVNFDIEIRGKKVPYEVCKRPFVHKK